MTVTHILNFDQLIEQTMSFNSLVGKMRRDESQKQHTNYWEKLQSRTSAILNKVSQNLSFLHYIYYQFIVRFPIGLLDFPLITLPFQGC